MTTDDSLPNSPLEEPATPAPRAPIPTRPLSRTPTIPAEPVTANVQEAPFIPSGRTLRATPVTPYIPPAPVDLPFGTSEEEARRLRLEALAEADVMSQVDMTPPVAQIAPDGAIYAMPAPVEESPALESRTPQGQLPETATSPADEDMFLVDEPPVVQPDRVDTTQNQSLLDKLATSAETDPIPEKQRTRVAVVSPAKPLTEDQTHEPVTPSPIEAVHVDLTGGMPEASFDKQEVLRGLAHLEQTAKFQQELNTALPLVEEEIAPDEPPLVVPLDEDELADATHDDEPLIPESTTNSRERAPRELETLVTPAMDDTPMLEDDPNPSSLLLLPIRPLDIDEYIEALTSKYGERFDDMYRNGIGVPGQARAGLFTLGSQSELSRHALITAQENHAELSTRRKVGEKVFGDAIVGKAQMLTLPNEKNTVQGRSALMLAMAATQGLRKVYLLNSGFYLMLRPPKLSELNAFYVLARDGEYRHGRTYGTYFYLPADTEVKKAAMEQIEQLVVDSNLKDWSKPKVIRKAMSLQDYDTVLWAIASLMYKEGVDVHYLCHNKSCLVSTPFKLDVATMRLNNYTRLGGAIDMLMDNRVKDTAALVEYHKLLGLEETIKCSDEWSIDVGVPSMQHYLTFSDRFNAEMASKIQITERQEVTSYLRYSYNRILSPWISALKLTSQGKEMKVTEPSTIPEILETIQLAETSARLEGSARLANKVHEYIKRTKLTHICYPYNSCPVCGTLAASAVGDVTPCDMQASFFILSVMKLND